MITLVVLGRGRVMNHFFLAISFALFSSSIFAIQVTESQYIKSNQFLESLKEDQRKKWSDAMDATVFFAKRGTGILIHSDGIILTAGHVIEHVAIGETTKCQKLFMYLYHREGKKERQLHCEKVLAYNFNKDFALIKVREKDLPHVKLAQVDDDSYLGSQTVVFGHPGATRWNFSNLVVSKGPLVLSDFYSSQLSHFLHLASTEGGHSGGPVFNSDAQLLGIHFRGIPNYGPGVDAEIDGSVERIYRFNVAFYPHLLIQSYLPNFF